MPWFTRTLQLPTRGKGLYEFTQEVQRVLSDSNLQEGICHLFVQHTSCSLVINENADPTAKRDLEVFFEKLAPENQSWHLHTLEGSDDSPSHMRTALTNLDLNIPFSSGYLDLGTWQGIYLFEHRAFSHHRQVIVKLFGE